MIKKIAFLQPKPWPLTNVKVAEALAKQFPDYQLEIINIEQLVKNKLSILFINTFWTWFTYGQDILQRNKKFKDAFWRTPYIFRTIKKELARRLSDQKYSFTIQAQSIFDCSVPNLPHFIYTDHTHLANLSYPDFNVKKLFPADWIALEREIYKNATKIFVQSSNIQKSLIEQYQQPEEKIVCVYAGNNVEIDHQPSDEKSYAKQNILFVGLDWERKGGDTLVDAFHLVLKKYPNATLTIAGAKPNIQLQNCEVLGKITPEDLIPHYKAATIFCMPTRAEPFGIVFLEAMQARLPIIGTNVGAIPDFLQNNWNGILVEPGDTQGIAAGIIKLLDDPELCRIYGERNFNLIKDRYSWQAVSRNISTNIHECLKLE